MNLSSEARKRFWYIECVTQVISEKPTYMSYKIEYDDWTSCI